MSWIYDTPFFFIGFHGEIRGILAYRITHGFSQIFGRWPMARARYVLLLFLVTQISQMTQIFLRGIILSHRFHRFTQIFFIGRFFIGFHGEIRGILAYRITHGFSQIFGRWPMARARYVLLLFLVTQISQMTQIFLRGIIFVPQI